MSLDEHERDYGTLLVLCSVFPDAWLERRQMVNRSGAGDPPVAADSTMVVRPCEDMPGRPWLTLKEGKT